MAGVLGKSWLIVEDRRVEPTLKLERQPEAQAGSMVGQQLGSYHLLSLLGAGGMGEVYRARDPRLDREVAIKVLPERLAHNREAVARFRREATAVAALSHPNILAIHEFGIDHDVCFAVMELLEGETLRGRLQRAALPWREAVKIAAAIADGLSAAHVKGIIHLDLKPENVFLTRDGQVKVLDFGIAHVRPVPTSSDRTVTNTMEPTTLVGTAGYMSPEQVRGERVEAPSDVFSLGCVLYEMLTGRRAFAGSSAQETMAAVLRDYPPALAETGTTVPLALEQVIRRCLEKQSEERFQSARDLALDLRAMLTGDQQLVDVNPVLNEFEEHNLADNISRLRKALGEDEKGQKLIETVPKRGYRFVAEVRKQNGIEEMPPAASANRRIRWNATPVLWVLLATAFIGAGLWLYARFEQRARVQQLVFKGDFYRAKWTEPEIRKGIELYNGALALDPNAGAAYAGLASAWIFLSDAHAPPRVAMPKAKAAALHALRLDMSADNYVSLGVISMQYEWDWAKAEEEFKHALKLDPHHNPAHQLYGWYLMAVGRLDEAKAEMKRALEADPVNDFSLWELGLAYYFARQFDDAVEQCRRAIAVEARSHWSHMVLAWALEEQTKFQEAISELNLAARLDDNPQILASLGHAHAASGRRDDAQRVIAVLQETAKRRYVSPYDVAAIYAALGEKEQTLEWLERAYEDRSGWLALWLKVDPRFDRLRSEPRFQNILRRVGHTL